MERAQGGGGPRCARVALLGYDCGVDRTALRRLLQLAEAPITVSATLGERVTSDDHERLGLTLSTADGDAIPALLFLPSRAGPHPAVVVHHQHNGEWHLGKSEVAGLAGDPFQAFGTALAKRGVAVLSADVLTFEDRRAAARGTEPHPDDWLQHYNATAHRLIRGELLMQKVLGDALAVTTYLRGHESIDASRVGVLGHSMGGTIALWHAALDERLTFACVSGWLASFARRIADGTGIGMLELIPGIARALEVADVLALIPPRRCLVVSATHDKYSVDAPEVVANLDVEHLRCDGGHALDRSRFDAIVTWIAGVSGAVYSSS